MARLSRFFSASLDWIDLALMSTIQAREWQQINLGNLDSTYPCLSGHAYSKSSILSHDQNRPILSQLVWKIVYSLNLYL